MKMSDLSLALMRMTSLRLALMMSSCLTPDSEDANSDEFAICKTSLEEDVVCDTSLDEYTIFETTLYEMFSLSLTLMRTASLTKKISIITVLVRMLSPAQLSQFLWLEKKKRKKMAYLYLRY